MSQTGQQDLGEELESPEALQKQLEAWERRQRLKTRLHAGLAVAFLIGIGAALWFLLENPAKAAEATGAAIAFALAGIFYAILALSSRAKPMTGTKKRR